MVELIHQGEIDIASDYCDSNQQLLPLMLSEIRFSYFKYYPNSGYLRYINSYCGYKVSIILSSRSGIDRSRVSESQPLANRLYNDMC